jgi:hypothetical protein
MARQQHASSSQQHLIGTAALKSAPLGKQSAAATETVPHYTFEPDRAVQAIVFHLIDEGIATRVAEESIQATVVRLGRMSIKPSMPQWAWSDMSNRERLQWLLDQTHTVSKLMSDETSILEPMPS